jgi:hypothetical protein
LETGPDTVSLGSNSAIKIAPWRCPRRGKKRIYEQPVVQRRTQLAVSSIFSTMPFGVTVPERE